MHKNAGVLDKHYDNIEIEVTLNHIEILLASGSYEDFPPLTSGRLNESIEIKTITENRNCNDNLDCNNGSSRY